MRWLTKFKCLKKGFLFFLHFFAYVIINIKSCSELSNAQTDNKKFLTYFN